MPMLRHLLLCLLALSLPLQAMAGTVLMAQAAAETSAHDTAAPCPGHVQDLQDDSPPEAAHGGCANCAACGLASAVFLAHGPMLAIVPVRHEWPLLTERGNSVVAPVPHGPPRPLPG
jgi:hypothetical protein